MVFINLTQNWHLDLMFVSTDRKSGKSAFLEVGFQIECSFLIDQDKKIRIILKTLLRKKLGIERTESRVERRMILQSRFKSKCVVLFVVGV